MGFFSMEHGKTAYRADFALYGGASVALAGFLMVAGPPAQRMPLLALALLGLAGWSLVEYLLHRFVLHGLRPFSTWHAEHHRRPTALICTPTVLSASLIGVLVFIPALLLGDVWLACALTWGLLTGYLIYTVTHHVMHHGRGRTAWIQRRRRWHAQHHGSPQQPSLERGRYGVTSGFWDRMFGTAESALPG